MQPTTETEMAEAIAGAEGPLRIAGGGTREIGRPVEGAALSAAALSGISLYEPGALTLVAQAGTPVAEVEAALAAENQRLAFEPMDHRGLLGTSGTPTIGGVVAGNVSGPRRVAAGACRDHLLGVRYVDGRGTVIKNGGRVMKNVTGYDLVKLMAGSRGTLGVLTEVSLKVLPEVEATTDLCLDGLSYAKAVEAMSTALGSPYEVTGAAHMGGKTHLRLEGFAGSVSYRAGKLAELLSGFGAAKLSEGDSAKAIWTEVRDLTPFHGTAGDVWKLSVKGTDAADLIARADADQVMLDWGGGLIWLELAPGTNLRTRLGPFDGHATLVRASQDTRRAMPVFQPEPPEVAKLSAGLRQKFDPRGILNTGLQGA